MTKNLKQAKARIIVGRIMGILEAHNLFNKVDHLGMESWNGKMVMVNKLTSLSVEELAELEEEIAEQVNSL